MPKTKPYRHKRLDAEDGQALLIAIHNAAAEGYDRFEINLKTFRGRAVRLEPVGRNVDKNAAPPPGDAKPKKTRATV